MVDGLLLIISFLLIVMLKMCWSRLKTVEKKSLDEIERLDKKYIEIVRILHRRAIAGTEEIVDREVIEVHNDRTEEPPGFQFNHTSDAEPVATGRARQGTSAGRMARRRIEHRREARESAARERQQLGRVFTTREEIDEQVDGIIFEQENIHERLESINESIAAERAQAEEAESEQITETEIITNTIQWINDNNMNLEIGSLTDEEIRTVHEKLMTMFAVPLEAVEKKPVAKEDPIDPNNIKRRKRKITTRSKNE